MVYITQHKKNEQQQEWRNNNEQRGRHNRMNNSSSSENDKQSWTNREDTYFVCILQQYILYLRGKILGEEAVRLEAAAGHDDEDVEGRLAVRPIERLIDWLNEIFCFVAKKKDKTNKQKRKKKKKKTSLCHQSTSSADQAVAGHDTGDVWHVLLCPWTPRRWYTHTRTIRVSRPDTYIHTRVGRVPLLHRSKTRQKYEKTALKDGFDCYLCLD